MMLSVQPAGAVRPRPACSTSGRTLPLRGVVRAPVRRSLRVQAALEAEQLSSAATSAFNTVATIADAVPAEFVSPSSQPGPFDFLADAFETLLKLIDGGLESAHVPYSYGFAIIALTILVKVATFPLSQKQVQSTVAMQTLQPRIKELQAKYANEPEQLQMETARVYKDAGVNPLAGCLPTLATIPVFIGLYKALSRAADEGLGQEPFFFIPDLSGPTTLADRASGSGLTWLFPLVDGHPPIGWVPALSYLVMPVLLIVSQYASMQLMQPPGQNKDDPAQQQTQAILKFLPLMIGWFSLNVPSGLTLYWFVNNILSTAQQLYLKKTTQVNMPVAAVSTSAPVGTYIKPKEEQVKKITGKDVGARRRRGDGSESEGEGDVVMATVVPTVLEPSATGPQQSSRGKGSKGEKFRATKAREAAGKAAAAPEQQ